MPSSVSYESDAPSHAQKTSERHNIDNTQKIIDLFFIVTSLYNEKAIY